MSTFNGIVTEFPLIRIDFFRIHSNVVPPLACFLSHVHSDHLVGLESLKAPFVYCSFATKQILLRLEKYPHRINFAKGVLEHRVQTYRHLKQLLKPIPLDTPTVLELAPGNEIRVTLIDANHCIGAVMFLIENQSRAVLYTGDIRCEQWWINSITRNPVLLPYAAGLKSLDRIYLDTTFATKREPYRKFPAKADGMQDLLRQIAKHPLDTIWYFHAWTFGYEEVWIAIANFLGSKIHVDKYRFGLYKAAATTNDCVSSPLAGFQLGNHFINGCLTLDENVRIHSCEKGLHCSALEGRTNVVHLIPVISRLANGTVLYEMGLGGGGGDLNQVNELEMADLDHLARLLELCKQKIKDHGILKQVTNLLSSHFGLGKTAMRLKHNLGTELGQADGLTIDQLIATLIHMSQTDAAYNTTRPALDEYSKIPGSSIKFAYSRHSSYSELCALVEELHPKDVYPCTVDAENWTPELSMQSLFGDYCSGTDYSHDMEMLATHRVKYRESIKYKNPEKSLATEDSHDDTESTKDDDLSGVEYWTPEFIPQNPMSNHDPNMTKTQGETTRTPQTVRPDASTTSNTFEIRSTNKHRISYSPSPRSPVLKKSVRTWAYGAATGLDGACDSWHDFGGLTCVRNPRRDEDVVLSD